MSEPFVAEVRIWGLNFAPRGWAFCNGQLLPVSQNTALFSLLGTIYGGDGRTTFALPDLQGRAPMHPGSGPGLSHRRIGEKGGASTETLTQVQMPSHRHGVQASTRPGEENDPGSQVWARTTGMQYAAASAPADAQLAAEALPSTGGSQEHDNMQPYLGLSFCIALQGLYPSRS